jgi:hypothetical protein
MRPLRAATSGAKSMYVFVRSESVMAGAFFEVALPIHASDIPLQRVHSCNCDKSVAAAVLLDSRLRRYRCNPTTMGAVEQTWRVDASWSSGLGAAGSPGRGPGARPLCHPNRGDRCGHRCRPADRPRAQADGTQVLVQRLDPTYRILWTFGEDLFPPSEKDIAFRLAPSPRGTGGGSHGARHLPSPPHRGAAGQSGQGAGPPVRAENLVRFPGSGGADQDGEREPTGPVRRRLNDFPLDRGTSDESVFLDRQPIWLKLAAGAALLYSAYLVGVERRAGPAGDRATRTQPRERANGADTTDACRDGGDTGDRPARAADPSASAAARPAPAQQRGTARGPDQAPGARLRSGAGRRRLWAANRVGGETLRTGLRRRAHRQHRPAPARAAAPGTLTRSGDISVTGSLRRDFAGAEIIVRSCTHPVSWRWRCWCSSSRSPSLLTPRAVRAATSPMGRRLRPPWDAEGDAERV